MKVLGIPVYFNPATTEVAYATGLWPFKAITIGPRWLELDEGERMGVLMHEAKHCLAFHLEIRLLLLPLMWTRWVLRITHQQEMDADAFAVEQGHGAGLLRVVARFRERDEYYPSFNERYRNMVSLIENKRYKESSMWPKFFRLGMGHPDADGVVTAYRKPLGYSQILNATLASSRRRWSGAP